MKCPSCNNDMIVVEYNRIELDYCTSCKGTWFDSGELDLLLESHALEEAKLFLDNILESPEAETREKKRNCPICHRRMKKTMIGEQHKTLIDVCREDHGLWFDGGEVRQLMRHDAEEHPTEAGSGEKVVSFLEEVFEAPDRGSD